MQESTRNIATTWWAVSRPPLAVLALNFVQPTTEQSYTRPVRGTLEKT